MKVERFVEKPDPAAAASYLGSGQYLWNSGMLVCKASVWLTQMEHFQPNILNAMQAAYAHGSQDSDFFRPHQTYFPQSPSDSIDYAVLEHISNSSINSTELRVVPLAVSWSDIGMWSTFWKSAEKDQHGNVLIGDVLSIDTENSLVMSESRLVATIGLNGIAVIETADAILVADKNEAQKVKEVVNRLRLQNRSEAMVNRRVYRPWGWWDSIETGAGFHVKRIVVKPSASLSLQRHQHRAEHWIVISGTAEVTLGEKSFLLSANQSTFIPVGEVHRLVNRGVDNLEIIEVQSGDYISESDIERLEDLYNRKTDICIDKPE